VVLGKGGEGNTGIFEEPRGGENGWGFSLGGRPLWVAGGGGVLRSRP